MLKHGLYRMAGSVVVVLLLFGLGRAATSRYDEQVKAFLAACQAEQQRLGLAGYANRKQLFAKFPSPEVALCRPVRIGPGETGEVVMKGKFAAGTKFLLDGETVEVVRESVVGDTYAATVKAGNFAGPSIATLRAMTPVSAGYAVCRPAVLVAGKYEWLLNASNGWRIRLYLLSDGFEADARARTMFRDGFPGNSSLSTPPGVYRAEFFKGAETKPFRLRDVSLSPSSGRPQYSGQLELTPEESQKQMQVAAQGSGEAMKASMQMQQEMQKVSQKYQPELAELQKKMSQQGISDQARQAAITRLGEVMKKMSAEQQAIVAARPKSPYEQMVEQEKAEFGCEGVNLRLVQGAVDGEMRCGPAVGRLQLKGTMKVTGK